MRISLLRTALLAVLLVWPAAAFAQVDFSGEWQPVRSMDNSEDPWVGDFVGLPLNPAGLARAESWDASLLSLPEYQCRPHGWAYIYRGPTGMRIAKDIDPYSRQLIAYQPEWHQSTNMPVYLDGRDAPPEGAPHTWGGFSTAKWDGDFLRISTTNLKEDYVRRNGAMTTDEAKVTTWWIRRGDYLTWVSIVHDPAYLSEPLARSAEYKLTVNSQIPPHPCTAVFEGLDKGKVPQYLPGHNQFLKDIRHRYGIADDQPTGGAESMYPEYMKKVGDSDWTKGGRRSTIRTGGGNE